MTIREILRRSSKNGWRIASTSGSHRQLKHPSKPGKVTSPDSLEELLDRAALIARLVEESILDHPACLLNSECCALADRAVTALNDLYQRVGSLEISNEESAGC